MALYYTSAEGGEIKKMPNVTLKKNVVYRFLRNHRVYNNKSKLSSSSLMGYIVHSVFFIKNGKINRIWDSSINGYRK